MPEPLCVLCVLCGGLCRNLRLPTNSGEFAVRPGSVDRFEYEYEYEYEYRCAEYEYEKAE